VQLIGGFWMGQRKLILPRDRGLAHELVKEELAASTPDGYGRDFEQFLCWCRARNVSPMPATPSLVAAYAASLGGPTSWVRRYPAGLQ
jgi:hypothetical protein